MPVVGNTGLRTARFDSTRFDSLVARPGVSWLGSKDFSTLPAYLAGADVGLVPYDSKFNEGSFPLKTLEYLAAGLPVVATDLPAIRWLDSSEVHVADEPAAFAEHVVRVSGHSDPRGVEARRAVAREHSWERRGRAFTELLGVSAQ